MAGKTVLKIMRCPTCGASLKAENNTETITCVYCGNSIVPLANTTPVEQKENAVAFGGVIKVEGIKTSSSALAYLEQFFEEYDWEAFSYAQSFSVTEIDKLADSLKISSADDKNTWIVCFKAISVPFVRKIEGCKQILSSVIEEYKKDNLDAYSKFDAYKRIADMICNHEDGVIANLEKIVSNAARYGATDTEISDLNAEIENIKKLSFIELYDDVENIPAVKIFIEEKNARIVATLAEEGIDAESEYAKAKALIEEQKYVDALRVLLSLKGYSDTNLLIDKIDKVILISDVLEIEGKLYFLKKESSEYNNLNLYPTENGKISNDAIIKGINKIIANNADVIYYLDGAKRLQKYCLSTKAKSKYDIIVDDKKIYEYGRKVFFLAKQQGEFYKKNIIVIDLVKGNIKTLFKNVDEILELCDDKMIYTISREVSSSNASIKKEEKSDTKKIDSNDTIGVKKAKDLLKNSKGFINVLKNLKDILVIAIANIFERIHEKDNAETDEGIKKIFTNILNIETMNITELGTKKVSVEGFVDNYVVYTQVSPNDFNKNLYIKALDSDEPEILIEQNIFKFWGIIANKLFYYIGNSRNQTLININCDGSERKEWPLYISEFLFEQSGWIYFIRKAGYNSILCKSRLDGSKFCVIAPDIEEFIKIKNGYLYYINGSSALVRVRMDGSNLQELCEGVESVLAVKEDKIIFISIDDRISASEFAQSSTKIVKSIYAVDFSGSGKIKLVYNVRSAKAYDENTVYYIAAEEIKSSYEQLKQNLDILYKLDVETNSVEKLLDLQVQKKEDESVSPFAISMIIMVIAFLIASVGFAADNPGFGVFGMIVGVASLIIGVMLNLDNNK